MRSILYAEHAARICIAAVLLSLLALAGGSGCTPDVPAWRTVTLLEDCIGVKARDEQTGNTIELFPQEGDVIQVRLGPAPALGLHPLPGCKDNAPRVLSRASE